jgi:hypothetical protein
LSTSYPVPLRSVTSDPRLAVRVVGTTPIHYDATGPQQPDRPAFVRAASGVDWLDGQLAIVQDDVNYIALCDEHGLARGLPLPAGAAGMRQFEAALGNKSQKWDLEAAVTLRCVDQHERFVAFGSGSGPLRERIVIVQRGSARVLDARELYGRLASMCEFSGAELNVEGAAISGNQLRLFQRGNGASRAGQPAVNATVDLDLPGFNAWLDGVGSTPEPHTPVRYDLGREGDAVYGFTDAATVLGALLFCAAAERSPSAVEDGEVVGCGVGVITADVVSFARLIDRDGKRSTLKLEGIAPCRARTDHLWGVTDADDPRAPALLCELALCGPWPHLRG